MNNAVDIPRVTTQRLHLTAFSQADVAGLADILSEPDVCKFITANGSTPERSRRSAEQRIGWHNASWNERGYGVWAIRSGPALDGFDAGSLLGWCGFAAPDIGEDPEILYGLSPAAWGKGLAEEAARASIAWLFSDTAQHGVSAVVFHRINARSVAILNRLGLDLRGTMAVADFYTSESLARDVLEFELWRLAEGRCRDTAALLFEAPYRAGQLATRGIATPDDIFSALLKAAASRAEFADLAAAELESGVRTAFESGVNEPYLQWYHRKKPL